MNKFDGYTLYRVVSNKFVAGFVVKDDVKIIIECAPILRRSLMYHQLARAEEICKVNQWELQIV